MTPRALLVDGGERLGIVSVAGTGGFDRVVVPASSLEPFRILRFDEAGPEGGVPGLVILPRGDLRRLMPRTSVGARSALAIFRKNPTRVILCAETRKIPASLKAFVERHGMIAAASRFDPHLLQSRLAALVRERLERTVVYQGGLIEIDGRGLLLVGDSGCGKTTCALCLAKRGAWWIADDRVEIVRLRHRLLGRAPRSIHRLVALKTQGVADVTQFVDPQTIKASSDIAGVVTLVSPREGAHRKTRGGERETILGIDLPRVTISVPARGGACGWVVLSRGAPSAFAFLVHGPCPLGNARSEMQGGGSS
jgi:hypothetical protein